MELHNIFSGYFRLHALNSFTGATYFGMKLSYCDKRIKDGWNTCNGFSGGACIIITVYAEPGAVLVEKVCCPERTILSEVAFEKVKFKFY